MTVTTEPITLTVVYESDERGWVRARVLECPEIVTCGRDRDEARTMASDALRELVLSRTVSSEPAGTADPAERELLVVSIAAGLAAGGAG